MDKEMNAQSLEHEIRNAAAGVELETRRIRQAMERMEKYLARMDKACADCDVQKPLWKRAILWWRKY